MSEINMNSVLAQMRAMAQRAEGRGELNVGAVGATGGPSFAGVMKSALDKVNETQKSATVLADAFERGSKEVDPVEVIVALQKANISFSAATQVRNKFVAAYQEIMNMPV
jgi:flagellar hook-basal body complex protein FliE